MPSTRRSLVPSRGKPLSETSLDCEIPGRSRVLGALLFTLAAATPFAAAASSDLDDRLLCPAELLVTHADARRFYRTDTSDPRSRGLHDRISAALATLPLTCRRYAAAVSVHSAEESRFIAGVRQLRELFGSGKSDRFLSSLAKLAADAPFDTGYFLLDRKGDADEREAGEVYRLHCHGCHNARIPGSPNPAEPLDEMERQLPPDEFFARMLLGVRGTPEIGLSNPLTTLEIGAMARFLRGDATPGESESPPEPGTSPSM